jgi:type I restriction enzyme R subunit
VLADAIRAQIGRPDISAAARDIERLLDDSIAGVSIAAPVRAAGDVAGLIDLSGIDFDRLRTQFAAGRPRTQTQQLRRAVNARIAALVAANPTRRDLADRFEELVARYNSGSIETERLFEDLLGLLRDLSEEERRAVRENLTEEELAIFDILTKPDLELSDNERDQVKRIARDLLGRVKHECEAIDWERKPETRAAVHSAIRSILDNLPHPRYDHALWDDKVSRTYLWIRQRYGASGATAL